MKIKKTELEQIVREELTRHLGGLLEAKGGPEVTDADDDKQTQDPPPQKEPPVPAKGGEPPPAKIDKKPPKEQPAVSDDPADKELDDVEGADEVTGGEISSELVGKTVQSITMEPKSKLVPGAQELVITFDQIPDPLRVIVNKSGTVKFYYKGLHNTL